MFRFIRYMTNYFHLTALYLKSRFILINYYEEKSAIKRLYIKMYTTETQYYHFNGEIWVS